MSPEMVDFSRKRCWSRLYKPGSWGFGYIYAFPKAFAHLVEESWCTCWLTVSMIRYRVSYEFFTYMIYSPIVFQIPGVCKCLDPQIWWILLETSGGPNTDPHDIFRGFWKTRRSWSFEPFNPRHSFHKNHGHLFLLTTKKNVHHLFAVLVLVPLVSPYSSPPLGGSSHLYSFSSS